MTNWNGPQPGPRALWNLLHANFPVARNLGIYNPRNVAGTNKASYHSEGRALDIGLLVSRPNEKVIGDALFRIFVNTSSDLGLEEIIWNRQIWSARKPTVHPYAGHSPHGDHVHLGFSRDASQKTAFPHRLLMEIGVLRTGLEDLSMAGVRHSGNLA